MIDATRCVFEVTAGIMPMEPEPEFTKRFVLSASDWSEGTNGGWERFLALQKEAMDYATELQQHPQRFNFVRVDWIWM